MRGDGVEELRTALQDLGLESRGNRAALEKRLRKSTKEKTETISQDNGAVTATQGRTETREGDDTTSKTTDLLFVALDVEATCEKDSDFDYDNELLEFPAVLLDAEGRRLAEFHSYVRPSNRPMLSTFCKELTGIRQVHLRNSVDGQNVHPQ